MPPKKPLSLQPGKDAKQHLAKAYENYKRYKRFLQMPDDAGWALVVLFYSALHLVHAHALCKCPLVNEKVPDNHGERFKYIRNHLGRLEDDYSALESASKSVRYYRWIPTIDEVREYEQNEFENIKTHLATMNIAWIEDSTK